MFRQSAQSLRRSGAAIIVLTCGLAWLLTMPVAAADNRDFKPAAYQRPDAETISAETRRILSDPQLSPRWSFGQWLLSKISDWNIPYLGSGFAGVLSWIVLIFCGLVVLGLLALLGWTIYVLWQGRARRPDRGGARSHADVVRAASFDKLFEMMRRAVASGDYAEAASLMMIALLRWLSDRKIVRLHDSKTNGDYVREYPGELHNRDLFRRFVLAFDATVYGHRACGHGDYQALDTLFRRIRSDAGKEQ